MAVNAIANVYNSITGNLEAQPVTVYYGSLTSGTGTITVALGTTAITGSGTAFSSQLGNNFVIRNSANTYVGKISSITSDTVATLYRAAAVGISGSSFKFQSYAQTVINFDPSTYRFTDNPNKGNGTITVYTTNSAVVGSGTIFTKQLDTGYQIFGNTYAVDGLTENLIGVIRYVQSNTLAQFTTVSNANLSSISYTFYNPVTINVDNTTPINNSIHTSLINWSRSGLIPGITQVKSYHPPVQDPVTGILVNFPATMHTSDHRRKKLIYSNLNPIDNLNNSTGVFKTGKITDFDSENGIVGSSVKQAIESIPINNYVKKLANSNAIPDGQYFSTLTKNIKADSIYGAVQIPNPPGLVVSSPPAGFTLVPSTSVTLPPDNAYQGPGANLVYVLNQSVIANLYPTIADTIALAGGISPPSRITDKRNDANAYYKLTESTDTLSDAQKADLAARASKQFSPTDRKKVRLTGVPAAMPGVLNIVLSDENPENRPFGNVSYDWAFSNFDAKYNKTLPTSPVNRAPVVNTIAKPSNIKVDNTNKGYSSGTRGGDI
jgi:hypothetical protein